MTHARPRHRILAGILCSVLVTVACSTANTPASDPGNSASSGSTVYDSPVLPPVTKVSTGPNIVLITTDDQALTDMQWMPQTSRLLGQAGVTFTDMLSPHPLCCPARAEIITGQYAQNNGVHSNGGPFGGLHTLVDPVDTIGTWLAQVGYHTGFIGKYLNGYSSALGYQPGWDYWNASATSSFGYYGYSMFDNGVRKTYPVNGTYSSDLVSLDTIKLVRNYSQDSSRPFFIWSSYYAPHGECGESGGCDKPPAPAHRHESAYPGAKSPSISKPSFNEKDVSDKPAVIRNRPMLKESQAQYLFHKRVQSLAAVDEGIAAILKELEVTGELDDTLIMFTSDNGYLVGEHRYHGKTVGYEESLKVPLLMRGPGIPAGQVRNQTVNTVDLAATIAHAAGATPKRTLDGRSLVRTILSDTPLPGDTELIQAGPPTWMTNPKPWWYRGVRTARYSYMRWTDGKVFEEMYDRAQDPYQMRNIAKDPRYAKIRVALALRTQALSNCAGAECHRTFGALPPIGKTQATKPKKPKKR